MLSALHSDKSESRGDVLCLQKRAGEMSVGKLAGGKYVQGEIMSYAGIVVDI